MIEWWLCLWAGSLVVVFLWWGRGGVGFQDGKSNRHSASTGFTNKALTNQRLFGGSSREDSDIAT